MNRRAIIVVALLGAACLGAAVIAAMAQPRSPAAFEGPMRHDFGLVSIQPGETVYRNHQFVLRNASGRALTIARVFTTCGCAVAEPDERTIPDAGELRIDATLAFTNSGRLAEPVQVDLGKDGVLTLVLEGTGRLARSMQVLPNSLSIVAGGSSKIELFFLDFESDATPSNLASDLPEGVTGTVGAWESIHPRNPSQGVPARWRTTVQFSAALSVSPKRTSATFTLPGGMSSRVPLLIAAPDADG